ncbi:MAG TPA: 4Fe-4S dicluster domain-containing protein [Phycisphaerae bacterium]|nr:4Fe-4S dicluster domain-containing protein [Phycisphaerae bacterium]
MSLNRRRFIQQIGAIGLAGIGAERAEASSGHDESADEGMGVLIDLTNCNGCRRCEAVCRQTAGFDPLSAEALEDRTVFAQHRRPGPEAYTVVNAFHNGHGEPGEGEPEDPNTYVKANCLHCLRPGCVSGCIVGALQRDASGAVLYDAQKCMGCRYCMVACPFQIPAYEYSNAFTPQVRKCTLCRDEGNPNRDGPPACVKACPKECLTWGRRKDLLVKAHGLIAEHPDHYLPHVYGEHEAGGTAWLYLSHIPFEKLGFLNVPDRAAPALTETIQHGVFKHFVPPVAWCGILALAMVMTRPEGEAEGAADAAEQR